MDSFTESSVTKLGLKSFLKTLGLKQLTIQTFKDNKNDLRAIKPRVIHGCLDSLFNTLLKLNKLGSGIYFCPNQTDLKGRKSSNITKISNVSVDFDDGDDLPSFEMPPTIVVKTKNGFHCYWVIEGNCTNDQYLQVQSGIINKYNGDKNASGLNRVLRLPGFYHLKDPHNPFLIHINSISDVKYKAEKLVEVYGVEENAIVKHVYKPVSTKRKYTLAKWDLIKKSCMALRDTFEASKHKQPSSAEGLSLLSYLQKFNGGRELFIEEVAGWGSHVGELEEIDKFVSSGYSPYSCKKLSDIGVCTNRQSESCIKPISKQNIKASPIQFINKKNISETVYKNLINSLRRN